MIDRISQFLILVLLLASFALTGQSNSDTLRADSLYEMGKKHYRLGSYAKASLDFEKALNLYISLLGNQHEKVMNTYGHLSIAEMELRQNDSALKHALLAKVIAENLFGEKSIELARSYIDIGFIYDKMFRPNEARKNNLKALEIYQAEYGNESLEVAALYINFGNYSLRSTNYLDAEIQYKKAYQIIEKKAEPDSKDYYRIYNNLGYVYRKMGDYGKAIEYGKQALEIKLKYYDVNHPSVPKYFANIGKSYAGLRNYDLAIQYMEKALTSSIQALGKENPELSGVYNDYANIYADMDQQDKALTLYEKAHDLRGQNYDPTHPKQVVNLFNMGVLYREMGQYKKALDKLTEVENQFNEYNRNSTYLIARVDREISHVYLDQKEYDLALARIQIALVHLVPSFAENVENYAKNPDIELVQDELSLLYTLALKLDILKAKYVENQDTNSLKIGHSTSELCIDLIQKIRKGYQSDMSKQEFNQSIHDVFELAIYFAYELYLITGETDYLKKSFQYSEASKASILQQNLNNNKAFYTAQLTPEQLTKLNALEYQIGLVDEFLASGNIKSDSIAFYEKKHFDLQEAYRKEIDKIETQNAKFYQLKYATPKVDFGKLDQHVSSQQASLIEYYYDQEFMYIFLLQDKIFQVKRIPIEINLQEIIQQLARFKPDLLASQKESNTDYIANLNALYALLIKPIEEEIHKNSKLIIIPHGILQYVSFESLCPAGSETDFRNLTYLIKSNAISYSWSSLLLLQSQAIRQDFENTLIAFAPDFSASFASKDLDLSTNFRSSLRPLQFAKSEIESAQNYFPGELFIGDQATESNFLKVAPISKIIHLATHAIVQDESPNQSGLLFSNMDESQDGFLNTSEIYHMKLQADLAIMSACNTGFGQLMEGEGVMSLGRAFMYAGCQSVIMSLWLANDESTEQIIKDFYKNSSKTMPKDDALHLAKINYLNQADALTAHPYFWANLVVVGNIEPLSYPSEKNAFIYSLFLVFLIALAWIIYWIFKKRKGNS